jgi:hypothetical protein
MSPSQSHFRLSGIKSQPHLSSLHPFDSTITTVDHFDRFFIISANYLINLINSDSNRFIPNDQIIDTVYHSQDSQCSSHRARP